MEDPTRRLTRRSLLGLGAGVVGAAVSACGGGSTRRPDAARASSVPPGPSSAPVAVPSSASASPSPVPGAPAVEVVHGPRTKQLVALTFHGAGSLSLADQLLTEAERAGATVTVFAIGSWLESTPGAGERVLRGGHALANHTFTHPDLGRLTASQVESEIVRARDVLQRVEHSDGGYFRPSAMDHATPLVLQQAGLAGYPTVVSFDVDPADYKDPGAAAVRERTLAGVQPGSIVSLHLGHPGTVTALPDILAGLAQRGLRAVTVPELLRGA